MARGWESKSVESQQSDSAEKKSIRALSGPGPVELELIRKKESLQLSLTRVRRELETSSNARYRVVLNKALTDLQAQLLQLELRGQAKAAVSSA